MAQKEQQEKGRESAQNVRVGSSKAEGQPTGSAMQPSRQQGIGTYGGGSTGQGMTPFAFMRRMMDDVDRLFGGLGGSLLDPFFDDALASSSTALGPSAQNLWWPQVEMFEREGDIVIRADLPGLDPSAVHVNMDEDALTIEGERRAEHEDKREGYFRSERSYGSFVRRIPIPRGIDRKSVDASFDNGVLEIKMKRPNVTPQRIEVRGGGAAEKAQKQVSAPQQQQAQQQQSQQQQQPQNGPQSAPRH